MPKPKDYVLTKGKAAVLLSFEKKLIKFFKPYGVSKKDLDSIINKDFLHPVVVSDKRLKLTLPKFKLLAKNIYDDVTEAEVEDMEDEDEEEDQIEDQYD